MKLLLAAQSPGNPPQPDGIPRRPTALPSPADGFRRGDDRKSSGAHRTSPTAARFPGIRSPGIGADSGERRAFPSPPPPSATLPAGSTPV